MSNPALARLVSDVMSEHINKKTQIAYNSATRLYIRFCSANNLVPFPADATTICAWMVFESHFIALSSLAYYLSGIRSAHIDQGFCWPLVDNPEVARTWKALKKLYPSKTKALKFPICVTVLSKIFPCLPGWPLATAMSHDDRIFVATSLVGVFGFLRAGEFLFSRCSSRPVLYGRDICPSTSGGKSFLDIRIARPKARWWLADERARCFSSLVSTLCPFSRFLQYVHFSSVKLAGLSSGEWQDSLPRLDGHEDNSTVRLLQYFST